jgi:peptidoglycan/LPS O-acetylase OafA/YrhL
MSYWIGLAGILAVILIHAVAWHVLEDWVDQRKHERRREVWDRIEEETVTDRGR